MKRLSPESGLGFIPNRLIQARTARGLTQTQLSQLSGITKQSISNYEKGKQKPKANALKELASALKVNVALLQKEFVPQAASPIYFRALSGLARREYKRAEAQLNWFQELFSCLEKYFDFVTPNIPSQFDISNRIHKVDDEEIDEIADSMRKYWKLGWGPISNLVNLLENNGALLLNFELDVIEGDAFSQWMKNVPIIVSIVEKPALCRDRFSLAHELGHLVLHSNVELEKDTLPLLEKQAHRFAGAFLLPGESWSYEFRHASLDTFLLLKERWKVSVAAQISRYRALGLASSEVVSSMFMELNRRRWRKKEPLDDKLDSEIPQVIKQLGQYLESADTISLEDIERETSLSPTDTRWLLNMKIKEEEGEEKAQSMDKPCKILQFKPPS